QCPKVNWCLIESDPGVSTESNSRRTNRGFGCKGVEVLKESGILIEFETVARAHIFCLCAEKEQQPTDTDESIVLDSRLEEEIYFANQADYALEFDNSLAGERDEASAFHCYVPINGRLYENWTGFETRSDRSRRLPDGRPYQLRNGCSTAIPVI
uniref:RGM_C domain-containing protein n=1 Tax=Macrostomum lignano TaxID=282301 RepID=A0A1I8FRA6_9PLAT